MCVGPLGWGPLCPGGVGARGVEAANDPSNRARDAYRALSPVYYAPQSSTPPAPSSGQLSLDSRPQAHRRCPGRLLRRLPGYFPLGTCAENGGVSEEGHKGGFPGSWGRLKAARQGAGAKGRASSLLVGTGRPRWQSWKLLSHVVAQRVAE